MLQVSQQQYLGFFRFVISLSLSISLSLNITLEFQGLNFTRGAHLKGPQAGLMVLLLKHLPPGGPVSVQTDALKLNCCLEVKGWAA